MDFELNQFVADPWKYVIGLGLGAGASFLGKWGQAWIDDWKSKRSDDRARRIEADHAIFYSSKVEAVRLKLDCFVDLGVWPQDYASLQAPDASRLRNSILMRIRNGDTGSFIHKDVDIAYKEYVAIALGAAEERMRFAENNPQLGGQISAVTRRRYMASKNAFVRKANRAFGPLGEKTPEV